MARTKGSKNIRSFNAEEIARKLDIDPLEVLLMFAKGDWKGLGYEAEHYFEEKPDGAVKMNYVISPAMRLEAAKGSAKYFHRMLQAVELSSGPEGFRVIIDDYVSNEKK